MTNSRIVDILKKQYPDVLEKILAEDSNRTIGQSHIEIAWILAHCHPERSLIYIATCLKMFSPDSLSVSAKPTRGLVSAMAAAKGVVKSAISNQWTTAAFWYRDKAWFAEIVNSIAKSIQENGHRD